MSDHKFIDLFGNWHLVVDYYKPHGDYYVFPAIRVRFIKDLYFVGIQFLRYNFELNLFNSSDRRENAKEAYTDTKLYFFSDIFKF